MPLTTLVQQAAVLPVAPIAMPKVARPRKDAVAACHHCGAPCREPFRNDENKEFCCSGCLTVYGLLTGHGLGDFYTLEEKAGVRVASTARPGQFRFLDEPPVRAKLVQYEDDKLTRVTLRLPGIHCVACVWLLENLFRLKPGLGKTEVNFPLRQIAISFETGRVKLSEVVELLTSIGYEPELKLSDLGNPPLKTPRRLWMQLGIAGFVFGNTMLLSIAGYFGLDAFNGPAFKALAGFISLALSIPVVTYSASDYWRSAWLSLRQGSLNIDVPLAAGMAALFAQSSYEVLSGRGEGYFDSLSGLLFFLLCGKLFQRKTYERLGFDRDYRSFFPLAATRKSGHGEERVALSQLGQSDHLIIRHGELVTADARLVEGTALIDYSFVTGESEPVEKKAPDHLYAGGRQIGGMIEVEMVKPVSQSYLSSLWDQEAFRKNEGKALNVVTNAYSHRFTLVVISIAIASAMAWAFVNPATSLKAFTSVLIVACPCALALAAPFTLGTAQRVLVRGNIFLKNPYVIESLSKVDTVVFDKTGTLTGPGAVTWNGFPLNETESGWLYSMTRQSTHPLAARLAGSMEPKPVTEPVRSFVEKPGCGMAGVVLGHDICAGSKAWLESSGIRLAVPGEHFGSEGNKGSEIHVAIDGKHRGSFTVGSALRPDVEHLIAGLSRTHGLTLLSGDNEKERGRFGALFGSGAQLKFNQSPLEKLDCVRALQDGKKTVMMVGDGLNDSGALKQADVGVAVVESISAFSPASDVIIAAEMLPRLADVFRYAKQSMRVVRGAFFISSLYNILGIGIAASGRLSPIVCAILMPLSSVTVVGFGCGTTAWLGRRAGLSGNSTNARTGREIP